MKTERWDYICHLNGCYPNVLTLAYRRKSSCAALCSLLGYDSWKEAARHGWRVAKVLILEVAP